MSFYAVARGRQGAAIYQTWSECEKAVKGFSGAQFKKFSDEASARAFIGAGESSITKPIGQKEAGIDIFIDGACKNNGAQDGRARAAYACHFPQYPDYSKAEKLTGAKQTNNRAEFSALLLAHRQAELLFASPEGVDLAGQQLNIYTDSELLYKAVTCYMTDWKKRDWRKAESGGGPVANIDLVLRIDALTLPYSLQHVKAHTGASDYLSVNNDIVDKMAAGL